MHKIMERRRDRKMKKYLCGKGEARDVVLLGPTTPLYPAPFFERGVTAEMGT